MTRKITNYGYYLSRTAAMNMRTVFIACMFFFVANTAFARIFTVNVTTDGTDDDPGNGICEMKNNFQNCSLRAAVMEANAFPGTDTIKISTSLNGRDLQLTKYGSDEIARKGDLDITESVTIKGLGNVIVVDPAFGDRTFDIKGAITVPVTDLTIKSGGASTVNGGVFYVSSGATLTLARVTMEGNKAEYGGAIYNDGGSVNLNTVAVSLSEADENGGAIYNNSGSISITAGGETYFTENDADLGGAIYLGAGSLSVQNSLGAEYVHFSTNSAVAGGAVYVDSGTATIHRTAFTGNTVVDSYAYGGAITNISGDVSVTHSSFEDNTSTNMGGAITNFATLSLVTTTLTTNHSEYGGAIWYQGDALTLEDATFDGNDADIYGGAIYISQGDSEISSSTFSANVADNDGGAIFIYYGELEIADVTFDGNVSNRDGGAIYTDPTLSSDVSLTIQRSLFNGNHADGDGGAVYHRKGNLSAINTTFSGNSSDANGGALFAQTEVELSNVTIYENTAADTAGGIYSAELTNVYGDYTAGEVTMRNSILAGNEATNYGADCYTPSPGVGTIESDGYNFVGDLANCAMTVDSASDQTGSSTGAGIIDPLLVALADNGGTTWTHALDAASDAVDAGNPRGCVDEDLNTLTEDQRGSTRPTDGDGDGYSYCDIGAYEL